MKARTTISILTAILFSACGGDSSSPTSSTPVATPPTINASVVSVLSSEVIEKNDTFWRFSWRVSVTSNMPGRCFLRTKYLDGGGVELHEGIEAIDVVQGPRVFTGQDLVDAALAPRVTRMEARISSCL